MTAACRVLFVDRAEGPRWGKLPNRFVASALELGKAGYKVTVATVGVENTPPQAESDPVQLITVPPLPYPLVCGLGRALETQPLRDAYALGQTIDLNAFDAIVLPVQGGLAHGLLMARATGEIRAHTRIGLWCDASSRWTALQDDEGFTNTQPLVADAMEAAVLALADALLVPRRAALERLARRIEPALPIIRADLASAQAVSPAKTFGAIEEVVFVGPLDRTAGALLFMDALEDLAARGRLGERRVIFLGPARATGPRISQELLGVRAQRWPFRFSVQDTAESDAVLRYLDQPGRLAVFAAQHADDDALLRATARLGCPLVATSSYDLKDDAAFETCAPAFEQLADAIGRQLDAPRPGHLPAAVPWQHVIEALRTTPARTPPQPARTINDLTVCVVTRDRPATLSQALDSIGSSRHTIDVVVIDNAGTPPASAAELQSSHPHSTLRLLRSDRHLSPAAAYNETARAARGDMLLFLDDDNILTPGALDRFAEALTAGWFDVVVTTLEIVDGVAATDPSAGRFVFLGPAGTAGLFFNGFGDRSFAIRREVFLRLGGFPDPGYHAPVSDWVFLARAQAAGLRIGVLQVPAVRYARRLDGRDTNWVKRDVEGGRRAVLEAYGTAVDGPLVARFTQGLQLR